MDPCITLLPHVAPDDHDIHKIIPKIPTIKKVTINMKSLLSRKRSKAILGIGLIAIGIGAISRKRSKAILGIGLIAIGIGAISKKKLSVTQLVAV